MRKWLARLSFSLIIVAAVLAYEGRQVMRGERGSRPGWAAYALFAGAAICLGLGFRGVRERHRITSATTPAGPDDGNPRPPK